MGYTYLYTICIWFKDSRIENRKKKAFALWSSQPVETEDNIVLLQHAVDHQIHFYWGHKKRF